MTEPGRILQAVFPANHATVGDILCYRRRQAGLTPPQLAIMVPGWTTETVLQLESQQRPAAALVNRYLNALRMHAERQR